MTTKQIDLKHHITYDLTNGIQIIKTGNGIPILENEPMILFRGRDKLALPMLKYYRELCAKDDYTEYQLQSINEMINRFDNFSIHSNTMKQPRSTMGK